MSCKCQDHNICSWTENINNKVTDFDVPKSYNLHIKHSKKKKKKKNEKNQTMQRVQPFNR